MRKIVDAIARKKSKPKKGIIEGMTPEQKKKAMRPELKGKTVLKVAVKPKVLSQTPVGMATAVKKTTKPNL